MKIGNEKFIVIPFEPSLHGVYVYKWYHSADYELAFGNIPPMTMAQASQMKNTFMIVDAADSRKVFGMIVLSNIQERNRNLQYHILISKEYQNQKIAVEATKYMLYHIFNNVNMYLVEALIAEGNSFATKGVKALGFNFEGVRKHRMYLNGEFVNMNCYIMTKSMFNQSTKKELDNGWIR